MSTTAEDFYKDQKLSVEEYFALEEELNQKFEYVEGEIFDMTGGTINHSLISTNVTTALSLLFRDQPCTVFNSDAKLQLEMATHYFYPDAMVLCEEGRNMSCIHKLLLKYYHPLQKIMIMARNLIIIARLKH